MDTREIKVGDKIRLRNGNVKTVTKVDITDCDIYPVDVFWGSDEFVSYTQDGFYWYDGEEAHRDIVEIIPAKTSEKGPIDTTKIKVGDKIRLRNGDVEIVADVEPQNDPTYPVLVGWEDGGEDYTKDGLYMQDQDDPLDIVEIIPSGSNSEESGSESVNDPERDDIVVKPSHYTQYKIEPCTFIMENRLSFEVGNMVKYACRAGSKLYPGQDETQSRITDLEKVRRYAEMEINRLKGEDIL